MTDILSTSNQKGNPGYEEMPGIRGQIPDPSRVKPCSKETREVASRVGPLGDSDWQLLIHSIHPELSSGFHL
jgi:hypothetical protein